MYQEQLVVWLTAFHEHDDEAAVPEVEGVRAAAAAAVCAATRSWHALGAALETGSPR